MLALGSGSATMAFSAFVAPPSRSLCQRPRNLLMVESWFDKQQAEAASSTPSCLHLGLGAAGAQVHTWAITGGPCSGKTTALSQLEERGELLGHRVSVVPEAATLYHHHGARLPFGMPASECGTVSEVGRNILWEALLNELKRSLEVRTVNEALAADEPESTIVLCDRGIFDSKAYLPSNEAWQTMLRVWSVSEETIASRYDRVFHLCPCPREAYNTDNGARRESYEEALALDERTWRAWERTHAEVHTLVGVRETSFDDKLDALAMDMEARLLADELPAALDCPPATVKRQGWALPPREIIALADTVAASADLSFIAPAVISLLRRVQRIDAMAPEERGLPAEVCHRWLRRSAAKFDRGSLSPAVRSRMRRRLATESLLADPSW